ncbi:DUF58 domain-containing protein [Fuerstiella marisgermanici]|uniref:DUF58 domain-containing protein n=1 Tax=Fuerstiella marisgermanici TaxID=1891926 RepID=A0A1P8WRT2_9PLAN|nr:DUF58 domain-containing protein [Fuerstiella marisgermanici]APZ96755.1 hypothetical protein Fuma_06429 [Fuerstiella marisgermanici]
MIPSRLLILLALLLTTPLLLGGVEDVFSDRLPGLGALDLSGRTVADIALLLNVVLVIVAGVDVLISGSPDDIEVDREISEVLSVGTPNPSKILLRNKSRRPLKVLVHDDPGPLIETERMPQEVDLQPWKEAEVTYTVAPLKRGAAKLQAVHLRFPTVLGLWTRHQIRPLETAVRIYPDIRAVYRYELMASRNRLAEIGVRVMRMPGQGREFERLREYRYGDEIRQIDWKATSRQRQLITREFNVERNQNIVLMVDCGRFMRNETDGISYLDRALNSAIMLSYIALGQGDNVSLMAFSNRIERFIRPVRGKPGIQTILRSTYDIQASTKTADYSLALEYLSKVQRKRALVILITFVTDELQLRVIGESLQLRSLPYLPMCVLLQDVGLKEMADRIPDSDVEAFHTSAAAQILTGQAQEVATMRENGVLMVDTPPDLLTERLINEYLTIKMRNLM